MGMNIGGHGFGSPDAEDFPTTGQVNQVVVFAQVNNLLLDIKALDLPVGQVLAAYGAGRDTGADSILGQSEVGDWLLGGQGNDVIDATASSGHNIINGNLGADTIRGGAWGEDTLRGGQGDDDISAFAGGNWISGDLGSNILRGGIGADIFHAGAGRDLVMNFDPQNGDRVQVDAGVQYTLQQAGSDVIVAFDNGGQMVLQQTYLTVLPAGWIFS
jgi:Ca2+-binding RTX toxin-like protein